MLIPDFVIGANAAYYAGRLLTTNPRDFFRAFPALEVLTLQSYQNSMPLRNLHTMGQSESTRG